MTKKEDKLERDEKKEEQAQEEVKTKSESEITIEALKQEIYELKNKYALAYADTENLKKRLQSEADQLRKYRSQDFLSDILPVIDNFERALNSVENKEDNFYKGVKMIYEQLQSSLSKEGVSEIKCLNEQFDPLKEQALVQEEKDDVDENTVLEILQKGYMLKDRVLRTATVKISKKKEGN